MYAVSEEAHMAQRTHVERDWEDGRKIYQARELSNRESVFMVDCQPALLLS